MYLVFWLPTKNLNTTKKTQKKIYKCENENEEKQVKSKRTSI